jgi:hypothetical protein
MPPPETVTMPVRGDSEVFSATLKVKDPFPLPLALLIPLIQATEDLTVQLVLLVTVMGVVTPPT